MSRRNNETGSARIMEYIKGIGTFKGKYETVKIEPNGDMIIYTVVKRWGA